MSFIEKLKSGLFKTKSAIINKIDEIFKSLHKVIGLYTVINVEIGQ